MQNIQILFSLIIYTTSDEGSVVYFYQNKQQNCGAGDTELEQEGIFGEAGKSISYESMNFKMCKWKYTIYEVIQQYTFYENIGGNSVFFFFNESIIKIYMYCKYQWKYTFYESVSRNIFFMKVQVEVYFFFPLLVEI